MPKNTGQKLRILHILRLLWERTDEEHALSSGELLEALAAADIKAERKTIYDDIEQLCGFGFDIQQLRGKERGYCLVNRDFQLSELILLADAVQSSRFITEKKSAALIKKLSALTGMYEAKRIGRQVHVAGRIKSMEETIFYNVDAIHAAINADKQISFIYFDWNEKKEKVPRHGGALYTVSPWALCWDDENYYLVAYDSAADMLKHYRVDKMKSIAQTATAREGQGAAAGFDIGAYSGKLFGMFGGEECFVTLCCKNSRAGVIIDRFGKGVPFRTVDADHFELTVKVVLSTHFYTWLMNFGNDIVIKAPDKAINGFKETAMAALAAYETEDKQ